jgi:hypothetical protein
MCQIEIAQALSAKQFEHRPWQTHKQLAVLSEKSNPEQMGDPGWSAHKAAHSKEPQGIFACVLHADSSIYPRLVACYTNSTNCTETSLCVGTNFGQAVAQ